MKLLVAYATSEGQTRKIARHVADRLADAGHAVELLSLKDAAGIDPGRFDRIILGASVHVGHYQRALADFVSEHAEALKGKPTLLLSVSLAAAGHRAEDWRGIEAIVRDFEKATGWSPGQGWPCRRGLYAVAIRYLQPLCHAPDHHPRSAPDRPGSSPRIHRLARAGFAGRRLAGLTRCPPRAKARTNHGMQPLHPVLSGRRAGSTASASWRP